MINWKNEGSNTVVFTTITTRFRSIDHVSKYGPQKSNHVQACHDNFNRSMYTYGLRLGHRDSGTLVWTKEADRNTHGDSCRTFISYKELLENDALLRMKRSWTYYKGFPIKIQETQPGKDVPKKLQEEKVRKGEYLPS